MASPRSSRRMLAAVLAVAAVALGACIPVAAPALPRPGPMLQVVVVNQSTEAATVSYEFESEGMAGGGEGTIDACSSSAFTTGEVAGALTVRVNGDVVADTRVPLVSEESALVLRIRVERDGNVFATGPALAPEIPPLPPQPVACGPE